MLNFSTSRMLLFCLLISCFGCEHDSCKYYPGFDTLRDWLWQDLEDRKTNLLKSHYQSEFDPKNPNSIKFDACGSWFENIIYNPKDLAVNTFEYWIGNGGRFIEIKEELVETKEFDEQSPANDSLRAFINADWGEKIIFSEIKTNPVLYRITFFERPQFGCFEIL